MRLQPSAEHAWFLEIILFTLRYVCVCVCVPVCLSPRPLITSGVIWYDIGHVWLVTHIPQLSSLLPSINWMGVALVTQCVVHTRQRYQSWHHTSHRRRYINYLVTATRWSALAIKLSGWMHSDKFKTARFHLYSNSFGLK